MTRVSETRTGAESSPRIADVSALRVDAPHEHGAPQPSVEAASPPAIAPEPMAPTDLSFDEAAQLQRQAVQLAAHLAERQRELDRRESRLNAQLAQWENEFARQRLTLDEQARSLAEREQQLAENCAELAARKSEASRGQAEARREQVEAEFFLRRQEEELELRETQVRLVEERLANEQRLVRQTGDELKVARERFQRLTRRLRQRLDRRRAEFENHSRLALEALERRRAAIEAAGDSGEPTASDEIENLRVLLRMELLAVSRMLDEREQEAAELDRRRDEVAAQHAAAADRLTERERELNQLAAELDARRAAVERSAEGISQQLQTVLSERLAVEELWARFAAREEIDALRPKLAEIESRLEGAFAAERQRLESRGEELEQVRVALMEEQARLSRQQTALEDWTASREREFAEKTRALTRRTEEFEQRLLAARRAELATRQGRLKRAE